MSKAERIAFVSPRFSKTGTVGGAETLIKSLAEHAAAGGRAVTLLTTCAKNHYTWKNEIPAGSERVGKLDVHHFTVDKRNVKLHQRIDSLISRNADVSDEEEQAWLENSVNSRALCAHLTEQGDRYDRIVVGPYLFGAMYNAAMVHPEKTLLVPCLHDEPFAYLRIMKKLFGAVHGFMFNTDPEQELARRLFEIPENKCAVVGMGIEPFDADPSAFSRKHALPEPYVMYSGRREEGKGMPLLCGYMQTFRERTGRDIRIVFTGKGDINASAELQPAVIDLGFVSEEEKHEAMAGAVAFVHPSTLESLGIVLLESWMVRTPVLAHAGSDVLRWQCERSNAGLWFRNYPEFEHELMLLLDRPDVRDELGGNGHAYVEREYSWDSVGKRMFDALDRDD